MMPNYPEGSPEKKLEPFALAVGTLCNNWAEAEHIIGGCALSVSRMPNDPTSFAIIRCFEFRDLLNAIKVGVVIQNKHAALTEAVVDTVNYIDNTLRPLRNRYVHDRWLPGTTDFVLRHTPGSKLVRPQARQPYAVQLGTMTKQTIEEVWRLAFEVNLHSDFLSELIFSWDDLAQLSPEPLLEAPPPQQLLRPQPETPRPGDKPSPTPQPPPQS